MIQFKKKNLIFNDTPTLCHDTPNFFNGSKNFIKIYMTGNIIENSVSKFTSYPRINPTLVNLFRNPGIDLIYKKDL